ncbi:ATP-binding protein [Primorskyibacter sp. 2E233]|uniref:sensor histidine kinase n=1 Tax=Primorskyibacter sp. 2E233 TaxID=3413431 RepID=UPI003BEF7102
MSGAAQAQLVELDPGHQVADLVPDLRYWPSLDPEVSNAITAYREGQFEREMKTVAYSAGYSPETWAAVEIVNRTAADGRPPDRFAVTIDAPLVSGLRIFLVRADGLTENLTDYSIFAPFDPLDHAVTRLRTPEFDLAPGEQVTLLAHVQLGPFPDFGMALHSPEHLTEATFLWGIGHTAFYAFALSCLIFFFGFQVAMRSAVGAWNTLLFLAFLGLIAFVDGLLFRAFYPQHPELQSPIGFGLLFALSGAGFLVAGAGIRSAAPSRARAVSALSLLSFVGFLLALLVPGPLTASFAYVLIGVMLAAQIPAARAMQNDHVAPPVGAVVVAALAVLGALAVIALILSGWGGRWLDAPNAMRMVFAFLLLATMTFLTANVIALRRRHLSAVEARVIALEAEAERSRELLEAERNYVRARELAALRQRQLATASHDLRQPLMSLRMTFDTLASEMQPEVKTRLNEAFDYLGALATGYVDDSVPDTEPEPPETEAYPLAVPLGTTRQMFENEAVSKGIKLRVLPTSLDVTVPPIALMRIVTNLVSNAIKYTADGRVVVGVRRANGPRICVIDTGPGMTETEIAAFRQAYAKGENSTGHGLGLSVCFELARANGMSLDVTSVKGRGTCFSLTV